MVGNPVALSRMQRKWWNSWSCIWYSSSGALWGLMTICVRVEELEACHYHPSFRQTGFLTTRVVIDAMSSLLTYSGEMCSIDPTMCFNAESVTSKSRIVCCEQTPSGPRTILVKLVIFLTSEIQCLKKPFTCPITSGRMTLLNVQQVYPFVALEVLSERTVWRLVCRSWFYKYTP